MKNILIALIAFVVGSAIGAGVMNQWLMPQLAARDQALLDQKSLVATLQGQTGEGDRLARLEAERVDYESNLAKLRSELETLKVAKQVTPATADAVMEEADMEAARDPDGDERPERDGERGRDRGRDWGRGGGGFGDEGTPEEREARRREFVTQMQNNMTDFFTGELEKSSTPEMQARLVDLETQVNDMMEIRRQMRGVESDEERDALRQAFGETMDSARNIMKDQQQDMINAIAGQFNITSAKERMAFQQAVQAAVESPFFQENPASLLWNTGGGGGGFGGRPSRGGGPPR